MPLPGFFTKKEDSPQLKGRKFEKIARNTINSGSGFMDKADLEVKDSLDGYRVDTKLVTERKNYTFSLKHIDKFYKECAPQTPVYLIRIGQYELKCIIRRV
jgi:hypothetical protein